MKACSIIYTIIFAACGQAPASPTLPTASFQAPGMVASPTPAPSPSTAPQCATGFMSLPSGGCINLTNFGPAQTFSELTASDCGGSSHLCSITQLVAACQANLLPLGPNNNYLSNPVLSNTTPAPGLIPDPENYLEYTFINQCGINSDDVVSGGANPYLAPSFIGFCCED